MESSSSSSFMEKYNSLDAPTQALLKEFLSEVNIHEGLTVFISNNETFQQLYPLLKMLSPNMQTLSVGGNFHPISWTPGEFIIPKL
jgi:hypothetical protein